MTDHLADQRLRIAIVVPPGGLFCARQPNSMETVIRTLTHHVSAQEDVRIFASAGAQDHDSAVPVVTIDPAQPNALIDALKAFDPHIVECHQHVIEATRIASHLPDAVSVVYRHNALKASKGFISRWRYQQRYKKIDHFVFVSQSERRIFMRDYPALAERAHVVPNAIYVAPWRAEVAERDKLIVFSGRAMPEKGVSEVCTALPAVLDARPDWRAVLLLNDWLTHEAWAAPHVAPLRRYKERVQVLHSAPLAEVQAIMKSADIALTPSLWEEPLGLTALEAHAAGVALISSGRGGLKEASGPHAFYVDPVTPEALTTAMLHLIDHSAERLEMARVAQTYVVDEHSPAKRAAELTALRLRMAGRAITA
ncbi:MULTISPECIES: glycosyltransferase family 4 protein [unclassified Brevundimonas]|uniref:glycosyltransferase family 4 protein n=1 Tax=unclassified Brevundimonas TaxID=2622653 RepID=UPI0025C226DA|nr:MULTISPECIES: glycosyltransferase family 4 protein [unclassified Brevundimonas]